MHQLSQAAGYQRIAGYDLARGIAVFVMLFINFREVFALQDVSWPWLSDAIALFNRRAAVVLVMVSGAGVSLIFRNMGAKSRRILLDRAVFLFLAGGLLSRIWSADILHFLRGVYLCRSFFCLFIPPETSGRHPPVLAGQLYPVFLKYMTGFMSFRTEGPWSGVRSRMCSSPDTTRFSPGWSFF